MRLLKHGDSDTSCEDWLRWVKERSQAQRGTFFNKAKNSVSRTRDRMEVVCMR